MNSRSDSTNILHKPDSIWDCVWTKDIYSSYELRKLKAQKKVDLLFKNISVSPDWRIVDLGCGGGYVSEEIYQRTKCTVIGIDSSPKALEIASNRLKSFPITFLLSDVCGTPIESETVDLIICCGIIEHITNEDRILNEIMRILKPGGRIFVTTSNKISLIWPQRFIKQWLGIWPYGYQKNWSYQEHKDYFETGGINILNSEFLIDNSNFKFLGTLDRMFSKIHPHFGRYIVFWGEKPC